MVVSLVTLEDYECKHGLLLLPCTLDTKTGQLIMDGRQPWIPSERLADPGRQNNSVMVGELSDFWQCKNVRVQSNQSQIVDWKTYIDHAFLMFEKVATRPVESFANQVAASSAQEQLERPSASNFVSGECSYHTQQTIAFEKCFIKADSNIIANGEIIKAYRHMLEREKKLPVLIDSLVAVDRPALNLRSIERLASDAPNAANLLKAARGCMSNAYPLADSQREAVRAFCGSSAGEITAVSGPPGTGKTTMLQAIVANMVVNHALKADCAPLIVCTSATNQAVKNMAKSFASVSGECASWGTLNCRWLPKYSEGNAAPARHTNAAATAGVSAADIRQNTGHASAPFEPLRGISVYLAAADKGDQAQKEGLLIENNHKGETYSTYSKGEYAKLATKFFMANLNAYAAASFNDGRKIASLKDAKNSCTSVLKKLRI